MHTRALRVELRHDGLRSPPVLGAGDGQSRSKRVCRRVLVLVDGHVGLGDVAEANELSCSDYDVLDDHRSDVVQGRPS